MSLLIDTRAGSIDLLSTPPLSTFPSITPCELDSGDVLFSGNGPLGPVSIGIELKSLSDLITSADSGRLPARQALLMTKQYDLYYLLIYGTYRCGQDYMVEYLKEISSHTLPGGVEKVTHLWLPYHLGSNPVHYSRVEGFLSTLRGVGFTIDKVPSLPSAAAWILALYRWWTRPWTSHRSLRCFDKTTTTSPALFPFADVVDEAEKGKLYRRAEFANDCLRGEGVGFVTAEKIARHFPSILAMVCAGEGEWRKVPGVGKTLAARFVKLFRESASGEETGSGEEMGEGEKVGGMKEAEKASSKQRRGRGAKPDKKSPKNRKGPGLKGVNVVAPQSPTRSPARPVRFGP
jgi:ERCC4-type nuclease